MVSERRIEGLDIARGLALVLALTSHCFGQFGENLPDAFNFVLRIATPLFVVLFGCMLSLAHIPKYERLDRLGSTTAYWTRAIECYLWYLANQFTLWIVGHQSLAYSTRCAMFLGGTPYVQILSLYTVYFLLMPVIITLIKRFGLATLIVSAVAVHLAFFEVSSAQLNPNTYGFDYEQRVIDLLVGFGYRNIIAGPSVLHALLLVTFGAWYGVLLREYYLQGARFIRLFLPVLPLTALSLWSVTQTEFMPVTIKTLSDMSLRNLNHPAYLSIYGAIGLSLVTCIVALTKRIKVAPMYTVLGRRSLFTFGLGNVIISGSTFHVTSLGQAVMATGAMLSLIAMLVYAYDAIIVENRHGAIHSNWVASMLKRVRRKIMDQSRALAEAAASRVAL